MLSRKSKVPRNIYLPLPIPHAPEGSSDALEERYRSILLVYMEIWAHFMQPDYQPPTKFKPTQDYPQFAYQEAWQHIAMLERESLTDGTSIEEMAYLARGREALRPYIDPTWFA